MSRNFSHRQQERSAVPPMDALELLRIGQWSGDGLGGRKICWRCGRPQDLTAVNDGHALTCELKARLNAPAGGTVKLNRSAAAFPDATGCDTCALVPHCKRIAPLDKALVDHGQQYHGFVEGVVPANATAARKLMVSHALVAQECDAWVERTE